MNLRTDHDAPTLAGVHHLKLPATDLRRSQQWYATRLGCRLVEEFHEHGELMGIGLEHPDGGPGLAQRLDPERSRAALGEEHAGVHLATFGWILPMLHDPDGHEVRFYTVAHHTEPDPERVLVVDDAMQAARRTAAERGARPPAASGAR